MPIVKTTPDAASPTIAPSNFDLKTNLLRARERAGLTQREVHERTGHPISAISDWERGVRVPRLNALVHIAQACNITLDELVLGAEVSSVRRAYLQKGPTPGETDAIRTLLRKATRLIETKASPQRVTSVIESARILIEEPSQSE